MTAERRFTALEELNGKAVVVSSSELRDMIRKLRFTKGLDIKLESDDSEIRVQHNGTEYRIQTEKDESGHRRGDGGELGMYTFLRKMPQKQDLFVSMYYLAYETYSDDSDDFTTRDVKKAYLLAENPIARQVFEILKQREEK